MLQFKATKVGKAALRKEILAANKQDIKETIKAVLENNGYYMILTTQEMSPKTRKEKISYIRSLLKELGKPYAETCKIDCYDATKLTDWANEYFQALVYLREMLELPLLLSLQIWPQWTSYEDTMNGFIGSPVLNEFVSVLRMELKETRAVCRLTGLSGLGKTKLANEIFKPGVDLESRSFSDSVLYLDAHGQNEADANILIEFVLNLSRNGSAGILVIDNCEIGLHKALRKEVKRNGSNLRLLTIDHNIGSTGTGDPEVHLAPEHFRDIIPKIVHQLNYGLIVSDVERIAELAQGFPLMAVLLAKKRFDGSPYLGGLDDDVILKKLIGYDAATNADEWNVLKAAAIFDKLGFIDDFEEERNFIASDKEISGLNYEPEVAQKKFYEICHTYIERGIVEQRGRYILVKPKPLALRMAAEWWKKVRPEKVDQILGCIKDYGLTESLCNQLSYLDFLPEARKLTEKLCGQSGPFGNAEVLNTEEGSRLFRALAEVNPEVVSQALYDLLSTKSTGYLYNVTEGRRNLVWTLEILVFNAHLFHQAGFVLFLLGVAENETWTNNATNQFLQLFHLYLSATRADLEQRKLLLEKCLNFSEPEYRALTLRALYSALRFGHFSRSGGPEKQGSKPPFTDYAPLSHQEMVDYWTFVIGKLAEIARTEIKFAPEILEVLATTLRDFTNKGLFEIVFPHIEILLGQFPDKWMTVIAEVNDTLKYAFYLSDADKEKLNRLKRKVTPDDFISMYKMLVGNPSINDFEINEESFINYEANLHARIDAFVTQIVQNKLNLDLYFDTLYSGTQQEGVYFGRKLAEQSQVISSFILNSIAFLGNNILENCNVSVLGGVIAQLTFKDRSIIKKVIEHFIAKKHLTTHVSWLITMSNPSVEELDLMISLLKNNKITAKDFDFLSYGTILEKLTHEQLKNFIDQMLPFGQEAKWGAMGILFGQVYKRPEKRKELQEIILKVEAQIEFEPNAVTADLFKYCDLMCKILIDNYLPDVAKGIMNKIISFCESVRYSHSIDNQLMPVLKTLFEKYFNEIWPIIAGFFSIEGKSGQTHLRSMLETRYGMQTYQGMLIHGNWEAILMSLKGNLELQRHVARMLPIEENNSGTPAWHPFTKRLLDEFGQNEKVLTMMGANLGTHTIFGSAVPLYKRKYALMRALFSHPIVQVREWATLQSKGYKETIEREIMKDEEWDL